jgi:hypothetical protein
MNERQAAMTPSKDRARDFPRMNADDTHPRRNLYLSVSSGFTRG